MRVLLVNDLPPGSGGGAEVHLGRLVAALDAAGDTVEVFTAVGSRGASKVFDLWNPASRARLRSVAGRFEPDVVHHHNVLRELSVSVLGVPAHVRQILTCHDHRLLGAVDPDSPLSGIPVLGRRVVASVASWQRGVARRKVDTLIGVSLPMVDALRRAGFRRVEYVPYFAPTPAPGEPVGGCHDVVYAGRLAADKGVPVLAAAFEAIARRRPDARLVVVGEGPDRSRLERLASTLGDSRVVLLGSTDEAGVRTAMARARAVVVPSDPALRPEGSPIVAIEAAMAGRPLVVSDDPGLRQFVERGGCGIVVPARSAGDLADAVIQLLADPDLAVRLGDAGARMAARDHTESAVVTRLREIYAGGGIPSAGSS